MKHVQPREQVFISNGEGRLFSLGFWVAEFIYHSNIHDTIPVLLALCCFMQIKGPNQNRTQHSVYHLGKHKLSG